MNQWYITALQYFSVSTSLISFFSSCPFKPKSNVLEGKKNEELFFQVFECKGVLEQLRSEKKYILYTKYSSFEVGRVLWVKTFVKGTESTYSGCHFFPFQVEILLYIFPLQTIVHYENHMFLLLISLPPPQYCSSCVYLHF